MKMTIDDFEVGDTVDVYPGADDLFCEFTGTIIGIKDKLIQVRDQDDDVFDVDAIQLELNTDED